MISRALLVCVLAAVSCGGQDAAASAGSGATDAPAAADVAVEVTDLQGLEARVEELRGHPCLVNFWATWCPPCVAELPALLKVAQRYRPRGLRVLGVSYDLMIPGVERAQAREIVRAFLEKHGYALPTVVYDAVDYDAINARFELAGGVPVTLALDAGGKVVDREEQGETSGERFDELARAALGG